MSLEIECVCGICIPCRRAHREMRNPVVKRPEKLSPLAQQILDEGYMGTTERPKPEKRKKRERKPGDPLFPSRSQNSRELRYSQRYVKDGSLFHNNAHHGTGSGYRYWGCRCSKCSAWNNKQGKLRRAKEKAQKDARDMAR